FRLILLLQHRRLPISALFPTRRSSDLPWPEHPVELTLQPGAELRVRVADEAGQPVAGQAVQAALLGRSDFLLMSDGATETAGFVDRKSTRLNSSHVKISYAVFCLKKKK